MNPPDQFPSSLTQAHRRSSTHSDALNSLLNQVSRHTGNPDHKLIPDNRRLTRKFSEVSLSSRRDSIIPQPYYSSVTSNARKHLAAAWLLNLIIGGVLASLYFVNETFFQLKHRITIDEEDDMEDYFTKWSLWWLYYSLKGVGAVRILSFSTTVLLCMVFSLKLGYRGMQWIGVLGLCACLTIFSFYTTQEWAIYTLLGAGVGSSIGFVFTSMLSSITMIAYYDFTWVGGALVGLPFGAMWFYFVTLAFSDAIGFAWLLRSAAIFLLLLHLVISALLYDVEDVDYISSIIASSEKSVLNLQQPANAFGKTPLFMNQPRRNRAWTLTKAVKMGLLNAKAVAALHDSKLHALLFSHMFIGIGVFQPLVYISDQVFRFDLHAFYTILLITTALLSVIAGCVATGPMVERWDVLVVKSILALSMGITLLLWSTTALLAEATIPLLVSLFIVCIASGFLLGSWVTTSFLVMVEFYESEAAVITIALLSSVSITSAVLGAQMARIVRRSGHGYAPVGIFSAVFVFLGAAGVIMIKNYVARMTARFT